MANNIFNSSFPGVYFNGEEIKGIYLNGTLVWEANTTPEYDLYTEITAINTWKNVGKTFTYAPGMKWQYNEIYNKLICSYLTCYRPLIDLENETISGFIAGEYPTPVWNTDIIASILEGENEVDIELKSDLVFSDDHPLDSRSVVYSILLCLHPNYAGPGAALRLLTQGVPEPGAAATNDWYVDGYQTACGCITGEEAEGKTSVFFAFRDGWNDDVVKELLCHIPILNWGWIEENLGLPAKFSGGVLATDEFRIIMDNYDRILQNSNVIQSYINYDSVNSQFIINAETEFDMGGNGSDDYLYWLCDTNGNTGMTCVASEYNNMNMSAINYWNNETGADMLSVVASSNAAEGPGWENRDYPTTLGTLPYMNMLRISENGASIDTSNAFYYYRALVLAAICKYLWNSYLFDDNSYTKDTRNSLCYAWDPSAKGGEREDPQLRYGEFPFVNWNKIVSYNTLAEFFLSQMAINDYSIEGSSIIPHSSYYGFQILDAFRNGDTKALDAIILECKEYIENAGANITVVVSEPNLGNANESMWYHIVQHRTEPNGATLTKTAWFNIITEALDDAELNYVIDETYDSASIARSYPSSIVISSTIIDLRCSSLDYFADFFEYSNSYSSNFGEYNADYQEAAKYGLQILYSDQMRNENSDSNPSYLYELLNLCINRCYSIPIQSFLFAKGYGGGQAGQSIDSTYNTTNNIPLERYEFTPPILWTALEDSSVTFA